MFNNSVVTPVLTSFLHTTLTATAQNYGAGDAKRIKKSLAVCSACVSAVGLAMGFLMLAFSKQLLGIYTQDAEVIAVATVILSIQFPTHWICGLMETLVGGLRGLGSSVMPMIVSLIGSCLLRIVWVYTVFAYSPTIETLFWSYPVSWTLTAMMHLICFIILFRSKKKSLVCD